MIPRHQPWDGAPGFQIGLRPIPPEAWLEGGGADPSRKAALLRDHPGAVWGETPDSRPAQDEVLSMIEAAVGGSAPGDGPPLWRAASLVADDLCLMQRLADGWTLTAASLCSPTFFTVAESLGRPLSALHRPVPGFADRLLGRVERIFDALRPDQVLERRNWTVVNSAVLFLPASAPVRAQIPAIAPAAAGQVLHLRVERQTLRKIDGGSAVFTIRIWCDPLESLRADPARLARFAKAWREAPDDFRAYKGLALYDALVEAFLADT